MPNGNNIIFSDEELFLLQKIHNHQSNRVYSVSLKNIPRENLQLSGINMHAESWYGVPLRKKASVVF
jgi:hypothetical protein